MKWEGLLSLLGCVALLVAIGIGMQALRERVKPVAPALAGSSPPP